LVNRYGVRDGVIRDDVNRSSLWWKDIRQIDMGAREITDVFYKKIIAGYHVQPASLAKA
jgi:hypothetical protein